MKALFESKPEMWPPSVFDLYPLTGAFRRAQVNQANENLMEKLGAEFVLGELGTGECRYRKGEMHFYWNEFSPKPVRFRVV